VYIKSANNIKEWDMSDSQIIRSPDIQGYKLDVNLDNPRTTGEIIIARRPLGQDEKGIAIMVGNHVVLRSTFGFDNKLSRVTGYVKCDELTSRFADKSALIENDTYNAFNQNVKTFIIDQVLPSLTEYEDVLITREESKIYKEIDKVMGQAGLETLEPVEEIQGFESVEVSSPAGENGTDDSSHTIDNLTSNPYSIHGHDNDRTDNVSFTLTQVDGNNDVENEDDNSKRKFDSDLDDLNGKKTTKTYSSDNYIDNRGKILSSTEISNSANEFALNDPANKDKAYSQVSSNDYRGNLSNSNDGMIRKTIRKPILKKTFTLKKIGYKVIPYEDETDPRYSFTNENIVFVNKAHSTYKVEAQRGDEFLFRHITNIVAEVVVGSKYPEAKDILEIQNKLISEAIKIHDYSMLKK
jgi:phage pi2 protein 07